VKDKRIFQEYGVLIVLGVLLIGNIIFNPRMFLNPENLLNIVNQSSYIGIVAVGMTLIIIAGGIDLSVGSIAALSGAAAIKALNATSPNEPTGILVAALAGVGVGLLAGGVNGLLISVGRLAPFIATLGGLVGYRSILMAWSEGAEVRSMSTSLFPNLGNSGIPLGFVDGSGAKFGLVNQGGIPLFISYSILIWIAFAMAAGFVLGWTKFGRHVIAVGASERAALYSGISPQMVKFWTYLLAGGACGVTGVLLAMRMNAVAPGASGTGAFYELDAIAAIVIGGAPLSGGKGRVWGTVAGVLLLAIIANMMVSFGVSSYWQGAVKGLIIILAVLLQRSQGDQKA
jgi:ribose transport system permease protein